MTKNINCNHQIEGEYCPKCGLQLKLKKIDSHYISHELFHLFHLEKGFFFNVKELFIRPAASIREFIFLNRSKHMKPVGFLIFSAILYTFVYNYFKPVAINVDTDSYFKGSTVEIIQNWLQGHFGYNHILKSFFIAGWTWLFFKKHGCNMFEIMTLLCFISGQGMLIVALLLPFHSFLNQTANNILLISTSLVYPIVVIAQFFDKTKAINYFKALLSYLLCGVTLFFVMVIIGLTIDFVIHNI